MIVVDEEFDMVVDVQGYGNRVIEQFREDTFFHSYLILWWSHKIKEGQSIFYTIYDCLIYDCLIYDCLIYDCLIYDCLIYDCLIYDCLIYDCTHALTETVDAIFFWVIHRRVFGSRTVPFGHTLRQRRVLELRK